MTVPEPMMRAATVLVATAVIVSAAAFPLQALVLAVIIGICLEPIERRARRRRQVHARRVAVEIQQRRRTRRDPH